MDSSIISGHEKLLLEQNEMKTRESLNNINEKHFVKINQSNKLRYANSKEILSNRISTSKYNYFNCIPKLLYEQFSKVGNLYFLLLASLQLIPAINPSGFPIILIPLSFVCIINGFKDFFEDLKRKISDNKENMSNTNAIKFKRREENFIKINWEKVKLGQIIKVEKGDYFPCDLILIYSSNKNGAAYVETKNLDGETNLKYKESPKDIYKEIFIKGEKIFSNFFGKIVCDLPNDNLYEFNGNLSYNTEEKIHIINEPQNSKNLIKIPKSELFRTLQKEMIFDEKEKIINLDYNNFLLRGCSLRNTDYIYGIAIYPGHKTKIMLNSIGARSKNSRVTNMMNTQLMLVVLIQIILSCSFSLFSLFNLNPIDEEDDSLFLSFLTNFFAWILTLNNIVPISLLVKLETIRFCQAIIISWDYKIFDIDNFRPAIVQTSGLNEELGQIHYIFTDKTGTLTKNIMQFKYMVINGKLYGTEKDIDPTKKVNEITNFNFNDERFYNEYQDKNNNQHINKFLLALALCHTIIISEKPDGDFSYNASSPDELALVNAARYFGCTFYKRNDDNQMLIKFENEDLEFKLLKVFEFNSNRKRMSVIIQDKLGQIKLICKGADSVILKRLDINKSSNLDQTNKELELLAEKGLRTLFIAERNISDHEYYYFREKHKRASLTINNKRTELMEETYELLEKDLMLLGATAIEDCLQDDLKTTLKTFRKSGIKLCMLTGDNALTAVSIAHSCGLVSKRYITSLVTELKEIDSQLDKINDKLDNAKKIMELNNNQMKHCFVMTGDVLSFVLNQETFNALKEEQKLPKKGKKVEDPCNNLNLSNQSDFNTIKKITNLIISSNVFIASRISPKQKSDIIKLVKILEPEKGLLAIGDGANDVNMITTADVGIGIMGNEGQQAARASDYILGKFSYLRRLMYVHGREAYRKNSYVIGYVLWKNCLYTMPMISLGMISCFSGQTLYDSWEDMLYNILFTAYPIGWFAVFDKQGKYDLLETNSEAYKIGMDGKCFNLRQFWKWYLYAFISSLIIFLCVFIHMKDNFNNDLLMFDLWSMGVVIYLNIVLVVNMKLLLSSNIHSYWSVGLFTFSDWSFVIVIIWRSIPYDSDSLGVFTILINSLSFFFLTIYIVFTCMLFEYGYSRTKKILSELFKNKTKFKIKREHSLPPNERKYTGFAFDEDVSNIKQILNSLEPFK